MASLQGAFGDRLQRADGLDLAGVKVRSLFGPVSVTLYGTLSILLAHQRRHLAQAKAVRTAVGFPR